MRLKWKWIVALLLASALAVRADMQLSGVMFSQKGSSALINGESYRIGDEVAGFTVVSIDRQSATLRQISTGKEVVLIVGGAAGSAPDAKSDTASEFVSDFREAVRSGSSKPVAMPPAVAEAAAVFETFMTAWLALILILDLLMIVAWWRICSKAGQPGWSVFIPFYNIYVMLKIADKPGWWMLLLFIPFVNIIPSILIPIGIGRKFGKGAGFILGMFFLPVIFYPMLAFGRSEYQG